MRQLKCAVEIKHTKKMENKWFKVCKKHMGKMAAYKNQGSDSFD